VGLRFWFILFEGLCFSQQKSDIIAAPGSSINVLKLHNEGRGATSNMNS